MVRGLLRVILPLDCDKGASRLSLINTLLTHLFLEQAALFPLYCAKIFLCKILFYMQCQNKRLDHIPEILFTFRIAVLQPETPTIYIKYLKARAFLGMGKNFSKQFHQKDFKKFQLLKITGMLHFMLVRKPSSLKLSKSSFNNFSEHLFYSFVTLHKDKNF